MAVAGLQLPIWRRLPLLPSPWGPGRSTTVKSLVLIYIYTSHHRYNRMAGGVGFGKMGHDSFRHNRALRNRRPLLKDNPYRAKAPRGGATPAVLATAKDSWQFQQTALQKRWRQKAGAFLFLALLATLVFWLLL